MKTIALIALLFSAATIAEEQPKTLDEIVGEHIGKYFSIEAGRIQCRSVYQIVEEKHYLYCMDWSKGKESLHIFPYPNPAKTQ